MQKILYTEFTRVSKGFMQENSVTWAHLVNEGKLDGISGDQVHLVTKVFSQYFCVNWASIG